MKVLVVHFWLLLLLLYQRKENLASALCSVPTVLCCLGRDDNCRRECYCDEFCIIIGDCCSDFNQICNPSPPNSTSIPSILSQTESKASLLQPHPTFQQFSVPISPQSSSSPTIKPSPSSSSSTPSTKSSSSLPVSSSLTQSSTSSSPTIIIINLTSTALNINNLYIIFHILNIISKLTAFITIPTNIKIINNIFSSIYSI
ncbi:uncharacterized protein LOC132096957 [Carassius carassius]|uniref:uncharacterized protein LOC132096957 n=1 Tax=Carassius carassius TaxID=217509 RepID=UPI002869236B|nr:uncharacterized protein LOC132096957 [Carassius carassius]